MGRPYIASLWLGSLRWGSRLKEGWVSLPGFVLCVARSAFISVTKGVFASYAPILMFEGGQYYTKHLCFVFHGNQSNNREHQFNQYEQLYWQSLATKMETKAIGTEEPLVTLANKKSCSWNVGENDFYYVLFRNFKNFAKKIFIDKIYFKFFFWELKQNVSYIKRNYSHTKEKKRR